MEELVSAGVTRFLEAYRIGLARQDQGKRSA